MPTPRCFDAKPKESWGLKPFCPAWPTYALPAEPSSHLSDAVRRALRLFAAGVSAADLDAALAPRCAQRLCMRVQILRGRVYVVAPHAKRCAEFHTPASPCSPYQRQRTPGLTKPNFWNPAWYPTTLEWHFYHRQPRPCVWGPEGAAVNGGAGGGAAVCTCAPPDDHYRMCRVGRACLQHRWMCAP